MRHATTGKIIADVRFAFWVSMFTARHDGRLWNRSLRAEFPNLPAAMPIATARSRIHDVTVHSPPRTSLPKIAYGRLCSNQAGRRLSLFAHSKLDGALTSCYDHARIAAMTMKKLPHVGRVIQRGIFEPLELSISKAADALGVRRATLSDLINGKAALTAEMALRNHKAFDPDVGHLLRCKRPTDHQTCADDQG
jgi:addiction module HigA family antidote